MQTEKEKFEEFKRKAIADMKGLCPQPRFAQQSLKTPCHAEPLVPDLMRDHSVSY